MAQLAQAPQSKFADINGVNKAAAEYYHLVYDQVFGVRACSLRLTNVYGPRGQMKHSQFGVVNWFVRLALAGEPRLIVADDPERLCEMLRDILSDSGYEIVAEAA